MKRFNLNIELAPGQTLAELLTAVAASFAAGSEGQPAPSGWGAFSGVLQRDGKQIGVWDLHDVPPVLPASQN